MPSELFPELSGLILLAVLLSNPFQAIEELTQLTCLCNVSVSFLVLRELMTLPCHSKVMAGPLCIMHPCIIHYYYPLLWHSAGLHHQHIRGYSSEGTYIKYSAVCLSTWLIFFQILTIDTPLFSHEIKIWNVLSVCHEPSKNGSIYNFIAVYNMVLRLSVLHRAALFSP